MSTAINDRLITRVRAMDWTGQKRVTLNGKLAASEVTVGELAEEVRERMYLPAGSYSVYYQNRKLSRTDSLEEAGIDDDAELELNPEVKAG